MSTLVVKDGKVFKRTEVKGEEKDFEYATLNAYKTGFEVGGVYYDIESQTASGVITVTVVGHRTTDEVVKPSKPAKQTKVVGADNAGDINPLKDGEVNVPDSKDGEGK